MEATDWSALSPARMWRDWIARSEAQWSESVSKLMKDERAGEVLNRQLTELQLMHRQFSELAQASLAAANLPSRSDIEALDERMGRLEDGLAQVASALSQLAQSLAAASSPLPAPPVTKPTRTRRPPRSTMGKVGPT